MSVVIAVFQLLGVAAVIAGVAMWSIPLALIVGGVLTCSAAVQAERKANT